METHKQAGNEGGVEEDGEESRKEKDEEDFSWLVKEALEELLHQPTCTWRSVLVVQVLATVPS